jgi:hypothetical protein
MGNTLTVNTIHWGTISGREEVPVLVLVASTLLIYQAPVVSMLIFFVCRMAYKAALIFCILLLSFPVKVGGMLIFIIFMS